MNHSVKSDEELLALLERTMQTVAHRAPDMEFSTTAGSPRWMASAAAATVLVVGVGAAGFALTSRHDAHSPLSPGAENSVPVDTVEQISSDEQLPVRGVKYATTMTAVGVVNLYDSPDTGEQCFTLALGDGSDLADCFPNESVHDATAYVYVRMRPEEPGLLIGLTDPDASVRVEIGNTSTEPDEHGVWVTEVPVGTATFIVETVNGPQAFRIQEPG